mmetsp:Transcript_32794/g.93052  ORF Transcript_32794/g.93052 Transcript_32794/m.93052 type:complete len:534 (-) Transcript_32794:129-1730(-)
MTPHHFLRFAQKLSRLPAAGRLWPPPCTQKIQQPWTAFTAAAGAHCQQGFASGAEASTSKSLKAALRDLYRIIHPDFFHDWPAERAENERSFAVLQEYLAAMESRGGGAAGRMYHFTFYLRNCPHTGRPAAVPSESEASEASSDAEGAAATEEAEGLFKVSVSLPPPPRAGGKEGARISQLALGKLMKAVGLASDIDPNAKESGSMAGNFRRPLHEIIEENAEAARSRISRSRTLSSQIGLARTALHMRRRVQFSVSSAVRPVAAEEELELYMRFAGACDILEDRSLAGLRVIIGAGYGVDIGGALWLDKHAPAEDWASWMDRNMWEAQSRQAAAARLRSHEASVANSLGLSMVFAPQALSRMPAYSAFLENAVSAGAVMGPIGGEARPFSGVPLCALMSAEPEHDTSAASALYSLHSTGLLTVPVWASPEEVYSFVSQEGVKAAKILSSKSREEEELKLLVDKVRKQLKLRHLVREKQLPVDRFRSCCHQLLHHSSTLGPVLDGLSICVADNHGVSADGNMVALKWNYDLIS